MDMIALVEKIRVGEDREPGITNDGGGGAHEED
jgi:hypothetical protein